MKQQHIEKFSIDAAKKILRGGECYVRHISWFNPNTSGYPGENLEETYPDCSYVLLLLDVRNWRDPKAIFGLVIGEGDELSFSERYNL